MPPVNPLYSLLKSVDQPAFVRAVDRAAPYILTTAGALFVGLDAAKTDPKHRKDRVIRTGLTAAMTIAGALAFRRFGSRMFKGLFHEHGEAFNGAEAVQAIHKELPNINERLGALLSKAERKILLPNHIHSLRKELLAADPVNGVKLFKMIIPDPTAHTFKELMGELGKLSMMGLFPVAGGILGGVIGNKITGLDVKDKLKAQTAEAFYQFAANIALCNVGAAGALGIMEALRIKGRGPRLIAMTVGIALVGVVFGSAIANFFSKNFMDGFFEKGVRKTMRDLKAQIKEQGVGSMFQNLNASRRPELADMGLHIDDFASVGVLAGMAWLEPLLSVLYSFSGFRAGSGYRSPHQHNKKDHHKPEEHHKAPEAPKANPFAEMPKLLHPPHQREELHPAAFSSQPIIPSFSVSPARTVPAHAYQLA